MQQPYDSSTASRILYSHPRALATATVSYIHCVEVLLMTATAAVKSCANSPGQFPHPWAFQHSIDMLCFCLSFLLCKCRVYVHCTAGLGRAPAVCIAWLYWYGPYLSLDDAYKHLTDIRPCGPNRDAIRGATYDVLDDRHFDEFFNLPDRSWAFLNEQDKARLQQRIADHWH